RAGASRSRLRVFFHLGLRRVQPPDWLGLADLALGPPHPAGRLCRHVPHASRQPAGAHRAAVHPAGGSNAARRRHHHPLRRASSVMMPVRTFAVAAAIVVLAGVLTAWADPVSGHALQAAALVLAAEWLVLYGPAGGSHWLLHPILAVCGWGLLQLVF